MIVLLVSLLFLDDSFTKFEIIGVVLIGLGILLMARGVFVHGEEWGLVPLALGAALGTAGYTLADGIGARLSSQPSAYVGWVFVLDASLFTAWALTFKGTSVLPRRPRIWILGMAGGTASVLAYWIAVWAMTVAPIALVAVIVAGVILMRI